MEVIPSLPVGESLFTGPPPTWTSEIVEVFGEQANVNFVHKVIRVLGKERFRFFYYKTRRIEMQGGWHYLGGNGTLIRRRPFGTFLKLVQQNDQLKPVFKAQLFGKKMLRGQNVQHIQAANVPAPGQAQVPSGGDEGYESFPDGETDPSESESENEDDAVQYQEFGGFQQAPSEYADSIADSSISESQIPVDGPPDDDGAPTPGKEDLPYDWEDVAKMIVEDADKPGPSNAATTGKESYVNIIDWAIKCAEISPNPKDDNVKSPDVIVIDAADSSGSVETCGDNTPFVLDNTTTQVSQGATPMDVCPGTETSQHSVSHPSDGISSRNQQVGMTNVPVQVSPAGTSVQQQHLSGTAHVSVCPLDGTLAKNPIPPPEGALQNQIPLRIPPLEGAQQISPPLGGVQQNPNPPLVGAQPNNPLRVAKSRVVPPRGPYFLHGSHARRTTTRIPICAFCHFEGHDYMHCRRRLSAMRSKFAAPAVPPISNPAYFPRCQVRPALPVHQVGFSPYQVQSAKSIRVTSIHTAAPQMNPPPTTQKSGHSNATFASPVKELSSTVSISTCTSKLSPPGSIVSQAGPSAAATVFSSATANPSDDLADIKKRVKRLEEIVLDLDSSDAVVKVLKE